MGGSVRVQGADKTNNSAGYAETLAAVAAPARLFSVTLFNKAAADKYVQVFDATAAPSTGAWSTPPKLILKIVADYHASFDFGDGRIFVNGIAIVVSAANDSYTSGGSNCIIDCTFRRNA